MEQSEGNSSWDRDAVFLRLTKRRKEKLKAIAKDMPQSSTPSDAIERAIDLASIGGQSTLDLVVDQLALLQESIDQMTSDRARDAEAAAAQIAIAIQCSKEVLDLLAAAAARPAQEEWEE